MSLKPEYSVIVPIFRATTALQELYDRFAQLPALKSEGFEIILVFDGGSAACLTSAQTLYKNYPKEIRLIELSRNFGQHNAILCGIAQASGKWIVTIDEDLQQAPEDLVKMIAEQHSGDFDVVYGYYPEPKHHLIRNLTSKLLRRVLQKGIEGLYPYYSPYRLIRADMAKKTLEMQNYYTFVDAYLAWVSQKMSHVKVNHHSGSEIKSGYSLKKLIQHSLQIFFFYSTLPIRFLIWGSVLVFSLSTIYSAYIIFRKLIYDNFIPGFATTTILLGFGMGLILFGLGIIGEYLYCINLKTTHKPPYIIKKKDL